MRLTEVENRCVDAADGDGCMEDAAHTCFRNIHPEGHKILLVDVIDFHLASVSVRFGATFVRLRQFFVQKERIVHLNMRDFKEMTELFIDVDSQYCSIQPIFAAALSYSPI